MIRKSVFFALFAFTLATFAQAVEPLTFLKDKSKIDFVGKKTDGKHAGGFKEFSVNVNANFEDPTKSTIGIDIDATSLWSDDEKLTNHLKNPDFFDVRKFPKIKFESSKIDVTAEHEATIFGMMTMLDKKVEVKIPCKVDADDSGITLNAKFKIDRTLWGMTYGEGKIDKEVEIEAVLSFKR